MPRKSAASKKTVQCTSCQSTTAVDLKLTASAPSEAVVPSLPPADFISITLTQAETQAAALAMAKTNSSGRMTTTSHRCFFPNLVKPSGEQYHGHFMKVTVNGKTLLYLKSEFHPKVQPSEIGDLPAFGE
jgi:hypothetical protein